MNNTLLPCPFCGGEAKIKSRYIGYGSVGLGAHDWYSVECKECRAKGDEYGTELQAIAAWNRRANTRQHALKTRVCPMCEDCPDGCPVETPKDSRNIVTNADRIRSMSVDEMAEFLEAETYDSCEHTASWYTDWLRQPVKEEHHEAD